MMECEMIGCENDWMWNVIYAKHDTENLQRILYQIQYMPQHCVQHLDIKKTVLFSTVNGINFSDS